MIKDSPQGQTQYDDLVARLRIPKGCVSTGVTHGTLNEAADRIEQQAREIAVLKVDAERYRWLRPRAMDLVVDVPSGGWYPEGEELDAAIDAETKALGMARQGRATLASQQKPVAGPEVKL